MLRLLAPEIVDEIEALRVVETKVNKRIHAVNTCALIWKCTFRLQMRKRITGESWTNCASGAMICIILKHQ
jgi:hypothetical protein